MNTDLDTQFRETQQEIAELEQQLAEARERLMRIVDEIRKES